MSELDGGDPIKLLSSDGSILIQGGGAVDLRVAGGGQVSAGSFQRLAAPQSTQAVTPQLFMTAPFTLASAGDIWAVFCANVLCTPQAANVFAGAIFTADIDGVPVTDEAFYELDMGAVTINTISAVCTLQTSASLAAGAHILRIFWQTAGALAGDDQIDVAANNANIRIGRL
jgi:hypothetical protein